MREQSRNNRTYTNSAKPSEIMESPLFCTKGAIYSRHLSTAGRQKTRKQFKGRRRSSTGRAFWGWGLERAKTAENHYHLDLIDAFYHGRGLLPTYLYPLDGEVLRTENFEALKCGLKSQQSLLTKVNTEQEPATRTNFRVALEIAKRGKPFTDGKMIKECVFPIAEVGGWFPLVLDESTDVSDRVDKSYEVYEELLDNDSIHDTITGENISKEVENAINKKNLRRNEGVVALVSKTIENDGGS
ncbi:hypothetical protein Trydic_g12766 [Trypoxylus dichotomus]